MEIRKHFKLYKSGKKWCYAAIAVGLLMVAPTFAKADSTTENQNLNNVEITQNISSDSNQTLTDQNTSDEGKIQVPVIPQSQSNNVDGVSETGKPNTFNTINNKTYYYDNNGILSKNQWYTNWGHSYYFGADGARYTNQLAQINNYVYSFDAQGIMQTDYFQQRNGKTYYFGADGKEYKDQFYNNWGHTYYFQADGSRLDNGFYNNWGHTYYFGDDGARWDNRFYNNWGRTYYFGGDGALQKQDFTLGHQNYYVDPNSGIINGTLLNAPYINQYQVGDMACEATALLEALHNKGYANNYNIQSFIKTMPISPNGNPNEGFGGGYQRVTYGIFQSIYPEPLAKWGSRFGNVQNISGSSPADLQSQLLNGNPVVIYVTMHWAAPQYGNYFWGVGVNNSHVMTLDGYRPGYYHVEDPAGGSYWVSASNFENSYNIKRFAVVVK
ncbi:C39 family peptidase [Limosilactobacillus reuteri]|uniref:C39 family peptidase n=1 Tax=Limosilactobacillus reuteri TaxID=1598 RepID=UPI001E54BDEC|nr:C39 family peptidase [Limosilactobacillus reuteri]MCC4339677.1 C39 family peptidase [Limosilactobacillus reuteri]MCC4349734.1 C39 family peptidase [Limosilactobacillus reuteri]MCC4360984.1 C39 family peptidase [Limosilactobacillus reuteri]MCC4379622.1 C39 family peptidase [Limosilactobacillus reuteri]MCC4405182.1 C39 family peptidase [Limosilactobacillus reuteri]